MQKISIIRIHIFFCFLFLSQSGFSQEPPKDDFRKQVKEAAAGLSVPAPDPLSPVSVNAGIVLSDDKKQLAVIMKVEVLENWHIYAFVPPGQPYIESELRLNAPEELTSLTEWETPAPYPYDDGIYVYKSSLVFVRYFSVNKSFKNKSLEVGLYYQTCDIKQCLPPELVMIKLTM